MLPVRTGARLQVSHSQNPCERVPSPAAGSECNDFPGKPISGSARLLMAFDRPGILPLARNPQFIGQSARRHVEVRVAIWERGERRSLVRDCVFSLGWSRPAFGSPGVALGAASENDVGGTAFDETLGQHNRIKSAGTLPVNRQTGNSIGKACRQNSHSRRIATRIEGVAENDLVNQVGRAVSFVETGFHDRRCDLVKLEFGKNASGGRNR